MGHDRTFRFLAPPAIFLGSLLAGIKLDRTVVLEAVVPPATVEGAAAAVALLTGGGLLLIVVGYGLGVLSHGLIWVLSGIRLVPNVYDAGMPSDAVDRMRDRLQVGPAVPPRWTLATVATFDHAFLHPAVHEWIQRRWQMMSTSINSALALALAPLTGYALAGLMDVRWIALTLIAMVLFVSHAVRMWNEARWMLEFQSYGPFPPQANLEPRAGSDPG
jgi:hypothetical protein